MSQSPSLTGFLSILSAPDITCFKGGGIKNSIASRGGWWPGVRL